MNGPTVDYKMNSSYPPMNGRRRRKKGGGCACDGNYAKSLQGICKCLSLVVGLLAFIIVGVSPYWRPIFVLEGVTWPFHLVMLITAIVWLATAFMYGFFLSGQHLEYPHMAWPAIELRFNIAMVLIVLFGAILEATNAWRWDMTRGYSSGVFGTGGGSNPYGYSPGMTFSQSINMNSYCSRYPRDCTDYFSLLTGNNSYYGNHIFASILLFILLIMYIVSTYFSFRTWRVFKRDMTNGTEEHKLPQPSAWQRFRFRISEIKVPRVTATNIRERFDKVMNRNAAPEGGDDDGHTVDIDPTEMEVLTKKPLSYRDEEMSENKSHHASSVYSGGHKSSRSHHSSHHAHSSEKRSRSSSNSRKHKDDRHVDDHRSEKSHRSSRSPRSGATSRSSHHREHHQSSNKSKPEEKDSLMIDMKAIGEEPVGGKNGNASHVASIMC